MKQEFYTSETIKQAYNNLTERQRKKLFMYAELSDIDYNDVLQWLIDCVESKLVRISENKYFDLLDLVY
nr:MAG TPA: hypothetical protein [Caudoviricetes sp.]